MMPASANIGVCAEISRIPRWLLARPKRSEIKLRIPKTSNWEKTVKTMPPRVERASKVQKVNEQMVGKNNAQAVTVISEGEITSGLAEEGVGGFGRVVSVPECLMP